ncbi:hypothetical protein GCK72_000145 [Caenorhabditis remanei]|uniref:F-box domain-containing protein n=1 Tax=Caenorhabditis remanei TaxID=31234 RepID=A0A6A5HPZ6_CAERE|nr:hypothetical protein GCK72_000145 [Caenorhabditis remanei]KAF1768333.1 hypothetical protein GCK72_000145 [Caenorhabditis remanei]
MVLSKPLPLRKLPMVVFRKVLSHLSPNELILLAQCSKITKSFVRAYYPKKLTMSMSFCHFEIQIFEECGKCYEYSATSPDPFRHPTVYCCYPTEESIKRTLELMDTFYDTLGAKLLLVKLYSLGEVDASIIIDRVHRNQPVLQRLKWKVLQVSESTKNSILGKLKCKELILEFSKWFKLSDLLSSTCDKFGLERSTWTGEDLNTFLKEWVKGRLPNLSFFWIDTNSLFDQESAKNGLELLDSNLLTIGHSSGNSSGM